MRYRATLFGRELAPWRARRELAVADLLETGNARRDLDDGYTYIEAGAGIEEDDGAAPMTPDQERWAETLAIDSQFGPKAAGYIAERLAALRAAGDDAGVARFREIKMRHDTLIHQAQRADRAEKGS